MAEHPEKEAHRPSPSSIPIIWPYYLHTPHCTVLYSFPIVIRYVKHALILHPSFLFLSFSPVHSTRSEFDPRTKGTIRVDTTTMVSKRVAALVSTTS